MWHNTSAKKGNTYLNRLRAWNCWCRSKGYNYWKECDYGVRRKKSCTKRTTFAPIHHGYHPTNEPFTLQYLAYEQVVWVEGRWKCLPQNLKEPLPYSTSNYTPYMQRKTRHTRRFMKECFMIKGFYKKFLRQPFPEIICWICFLKYNYYPFIDSSPPQLGDKTTCPYGEAHFESFYYTKTNNLIVKRRSRRIFNKKGTEHENKWYEKIKTILSLHYAR